jgi:hypothetical protein
LVAYRIVDGKVTLKGDDLGMIMKLGKSATTADAFTTFTKNATHYASVVEHFDGGLSGWTGMRPSGLADATVDQPGATFVKYATNRLTISSPGVPVNIEYIVNSGTKIYSFVGIDIPTQGIKINKGVVDADDLAQFNPVASGDDPYEANLFVVYDRDGDQNYAKIIIIVKATPVAP